MQQRPTSVAGLSWAVLKQKWQGLSKIAKVAILGAGLVLGAWGASHAMCSSCCQASSSAPCHR